MRLLEGLFEHAQGVAEVQGLYGPLQVLENRIQQLWALQEFQPGNWQTRSGQQLKVIEPGWSNHGAGPDFREAIVELDQQRRIGDIELHLYREDWWRHGHDRDPRYNQVVLHAVLFPGGIERVVTTAAATQPQEWTLAPWLREDLETVCGGEPGILGERTPELSAWADGLDMERADSVLRYGAERRWLNKEAMAYALLRDHPWPAVVHALMLYHLGSPYNRRPFLLIATEFPLECWTDDWLPTRLRGRDDLGVNWGWGRPANRPAVRLRQYQQLCVHGCGWPERLLTCRQIPAGWQQWELLPTAALQRITAFNSWGAWFTNTVLAGLLPAAIAQRLWVDAALPLLAAAARMPSALAKLLWYHAPAVSCPDAFVQLLRRSPFATAGQPRLCNGKVQALYWQQDQHRMERLRRGMGEPAGTAPAAICKRL